MSRCQDKSEAILKAAEKIIRERRYHEITLEDIASKARVGKGTIYRYFADKDDLFFQLANRGHEELCEVIEESARSEEKVPFEKKLEAMCERIGEFLQRRHALLRVMREHEGRMRAYCRSKREVFEERRRRLRSAVGKVLALGIPTGKIRDDIPLESLAQFLLSLLWARQVSLAHSCEAQPPLSMVIDLFLHGAGGKQG